MTLKLITLLSSMWFSIGPKEAEPPTWEETQRNTEGLVLVIGAPGAKIYVDKQPMGEIPKTIALEEGIHFFKMVVDDQECTVGRDIRFYRNGPPPVVHIQC